MGAFLFQLVRMKTSAAQSFVYQYSNLPELKIRGHNDFYLIGLPQYFDLV